MSVVQRELYLSPLTKHPAVVAIGQSVQTKARDGFDQHAHESLEICLVTGGSIGYRTGDTSYTLGPDSIQISQPRDPHRTAGHWLHPCTLTWVQINLTKISSADTRSELKRLPLQLDSGAATLLPLLRGMLDECRNREVRAEMMQEGHLFLFLARLIRFSQGSRAECVPAKLTRALDLIDKLFPQWLRVGELSDSLGIHRSQLHKLFLRHLRMSPQAYLQEKILSEAARKLSSSDKAISTLAFDLQFSSTQHFATAFRGKYGCTPTAFRRQVRLSSGRSE